MNARLEPTDPSGPVLVEGIHFRTGEPIALRLKEGRIAEIKRKRDESNEALPCVAPGLVDLQINGYGGWDFNQVPINEQAAERVTHMLYGEGVTTYFPTVITNSDEAIAEALHSIVRARAEDSLIERAIGGIHLEGPFISPEDGPRGAHNSDYVRAPDWSLFQRWQEVAEGTIRILTLSPEWPEAPEFIAKCVESGVTVAIGHTAATPEQIQEAVAAGALMSTHLGNGAHPMLPRHPNYIWEQLAQDDLWACVIADGFHLPNSVLKVVLRTKSERAILVSDAVALSGMEPGQYDTPIGSRVVLAPEGKLYLADTPELLAGSVKTLREGIEHLVLSQLSNLPEAWEMASTRPATLLHLPTRPGLSAGAPADLVVFRYASRRIDVLRTYKEGRMVHRSASEGATEEERQ